jgi:hypothetical protein
MAGSDGEAWEGLRNLIQHIFLQENLWYIYTVNTAGIKLNLYIAQWMNKLFMYTVRSKKNLLYTVYVQRMFFKALFVLKKNFTQISKIEI